MSEEEVVYSRWVEPLHEDVPPPGAGNFTVIPADDGSEEMKAITRSNQEAGTITFVKAISRAENSAS